MENGRGGSYVDLVDPKHVAIDIPKIVISPVVRETSGRIIWLEKMAGPEGFEPSTARLRASPGQSRRVLYQTELPGGLPLTGPEPADKNVSPLLFYLILKQLFQLLSASLTKIG